MYHLSVLPPKQHKIPLIISRQISIANVSHNLTDAPVGLFRRFVLKSEIKVLYSEGSLVGLALSNVIFLAKITVRPITLIR